VASVSEIFDIAPPSVVSAARSHRPKSAARSSELVLYLFALLAYPAWVSDDRDKLSPATAEDVAEALAFALRFQGRKRVHNADELMSSIAAKRLVEHLERCGFVVMKKPPIGGSTPPYRG
jgi:hypothetical protein